MSEKEKEREEGEGEEEEEEAEIVEHWSHEHPLTLVEPRRGDKCYGCECHFSIGEQGYGCSKKCGYGKVLHEECAKMARNIRHQLHPQHILIQQPMRVDWWWPACAVCNHIIWGIGYQCSSSEYCFNMHMRCAQASGVIDAADDDEEQRQSRCRVIHHPSHPHELRWSSRSCSFKCDACGTTRRGNFCTCIACEYWIHERCASLPQTIKREDHHHSLSLCFRLPLEYIIYDYRCDVCYQTLLPKYWMYQCELCRYMVHIKCAFKNRPRTITNNAANEKGIIRFPVNDVGEEQIRAFVMRQGGGIPPIIPHDEDKYDFFHHKLQLTLISSSSSTTTHDDQTQKEEEEEEEDDDDDYGKGHELICDGCITPIFSSSSSSSYSSSSEKYYYYMSCSECKYYIHLACFHLPQKLPSLPLLHHAHHDLILQSCDKLKPWESRSCRVCYRDTNGLFYACTRCEYFIVDIKCASMPDTIYHAAHPQHLLNLLSKEALRRRNYYSRSLLCAAGCGYLIEGDNCYACDSCEFVVHLRCAGLPASTSSRRWDKHHPLLLTHDANLNHPGGFCCDECETEMNPKSWMYHCRHCDLSFHPYCFLLTSGRYQNIKFGQQYEIRSGTAHPHPLSYQLLTTKRRCDLCHNDWHQYPGFHCALCNFFICLHSCGYELIWNGHFQAID